MGRLTLSDIKDNIDYKKKIVSMPEWGGDVEIRSLSVKQEMALQSIKDNDDIIFKLIQMCCINEDGSALFPDISEIENKSSASVIKLYEEIIKINKKEEGAVEELAKNS